MINIFLYSVFIVDGISMEPNLNDKELVLLKKHYPTPKRGDVVVVRYPGDPENKKYVKRVVGLPSEKIQVKELKVYINEKHLEEEDYLSINIPTQTNGIWQLDEKSYFLMGDNRPSSNDSRYFGPVEKRFIFGKATTVLFPRLIPVRTFYQN